MDTDIKDIARLLQKYPDDGWALWLQDDLRQAIIDKEFTPELAQDLTYIGFDNQAEVDAWLRDCWTTWFPDDPYPAA